MVLFEWMGKLNFRVINQTFGKTTLFIQLKLSNEIESQPKHERTFCPLNLRIKHAASRQNEANSIALTFV